MKEADYLSIQLELFDRCEWQPTESTQDSLYGKTYPERSQAITDWISRPCLKRSDRPRFQCLRTTGGQIQGWYNAMSARLPGGSLMLNIGASPGVGVESFLSQILEPAGDVPEKYYLSSRACQGILNRAAKRGKQLPPMLKKALENQSQCGCAQEKVGGQRTIALSQPKPDACGEHKRPDGVPTDGEYP